MTTVLGESIDKIRRYKKLLKEFPDDGGYKRTVKKEWDNINFIFRSDEMHAVYEIEGLFDSVVIFWFASELAYYLDDLCRSLVGVEISIKIKEMRGTDIGRMQLFDD